MAARLMGRGWLGFAGVLVGLVAPAGGARAAERRVERDIAPGVHLTQILREGVALPLVATALTIDPKTPGLRLETPLASGHVSDQTALKGRATVSALAVRENALVAVNGDFFPFTGDPLGLLIHKGELISEPNPLRSVVGFARGEAPVFGILSLQATVTVEAPDGTTQSTPLSGLNRARGTNELILYTPVFGATTATNRLGTEAVLEGLPLPLSCGRFAGQVRNILAGGGTALAPGQVVLSGHGTAGEWLRRNVAAGNRVTVELRLVPSAATTTSADAWCALREVVGGGPFLLRKGAVAVDWVAQKMQPDITAKRAPRTAVGVTREGKIVLVAIDGRQPFSAGTTLDETARLMQQLGAVDAMNLDGGGSTAMALLGVIVNSPSGGAERPVADGVTLVADQLPSVPDPGELEASPLTATVAAGSVVALRLRSPGTPNATDAPANAADPSAAASPVGGLNPVGLVWSCQGPGFV
ncbi:MAG TPA: phosphodiester glycosidase family protein, partial [Armatimonadota bacterium]